MSTELRQVPSRRERGEVDKTLKVVAEREFDEVVIIGFRDGRSFLYHSGLADIDRIIGSMESIKFRLLEKA